MSDVRGMQRVVWLSELSQRRLGLLAQVRDKLAEELNITSVSEQSEKLYAQYAELFGKLDETIVAEARHLVGLYDGVADITAEEARYLVELLQDRRKAT